MEERDAGYPPGLYVGALAPRLRENETPHCLLLTARDLPSRQSSASLLDCRRTKRVSPFLEMKFGWDASKARNNAAKQGVTFEEAASVFSDPLVRYELENRNGEERILATGMSARPRILFVVCVERDDDIYRIVSARKATKHERKTYQEGN